MQFRSQSPLETRMDLVDSHSSLSCLAPTAHNALQMGVSRPAPSPQIGIMNRRPNTGIYDFYLGGGEGYYFLDGDISKFSDFYLSQQSRETTPSTVSNVKRPTRNNSFSQATCIPILILRSTAPTPTTQAPTPTNSLTRALRTTTSTPQRERNQYLT